MADASKNIAGRLRGRPRNISEMDEKMREMMDTFRMMAEAVKDQTTISVNILKQYQENHRTQNEVNIRNNNYMYQGWLEFQKAGLPAFRGTYEPMMAEGWLNEIEKIFQLLHNTDEQKVTYATYMLKDEAENWWSGAKQLMETRGISLTWESFKKTFLERYFPEHVRQAKEIEFFQLKQRDMPFEEYLAKFEELAKYSTYLRLHPDEAWKSSQLEAGLDWQIRTQIALMEIRDFAVLVNKCRIVSKNLEERQQMNQRFATCQKQLIRNLNVKGKKFKPPQRSFSGNRKPDVANCPRCENKHGNEPCHYRMPVTCYKCGKRGHIAKYCSFGENQQGPSGSRSQTSGRVFILDRANVEKSLGLM